MRSPDSITADASARSTSSRSSVSVENGLAEPLPGRQRVADEDEQPRRAGRGDGGDQAAPTPARPGRRAGGRWRGATPIATNETTSIAPIAVSTVGHQASYAACISSVTRHDRGDLAEQPQQQRRVEVARQVVEEHDQPPGACSTSVRSSSARARKPDNAASASAAENSPRDHEGRRGGGSSQAFTGRVLGRQAARMSS